MMFDKRTKNAICYGWKITTRRLFNPNRRPAIPGHKHKIKIDRTPTVYGEIYIIDCYPQKFGRMKEVDAHLEGFDSLKEYKEYFYKKNGYIDDDEIVWVIDFRLIWGTSKGVIL